MLLILFAVIIFLSKNRGAQQKVNSYTTLKGVNVKGDTSVIILEKYHKLIVAYISTSCGVCEDEIPDLLNNFKLFDTELIFISGDSYQTLSKKFSQQNDVRVRILSLSEQELVKFKLTQTPHYIFYKDGKIIHENKGKINAGKYIKKIFG